jgi:hypothetical protein
MTLPHWVSKAIGRPAVSAPFLTLTVQADDLYQSAVRWCRHFELLLSTRGMGEAKRHQTYARLLKEYPTRSRREIARAIEAAVREL